MPKHDDNQTTRTETETNKKPANSDNNYGGLLRRTDRYAMAVRSYGAMRGITSRRAG